MAVQSLHRIQLLRLPWTIARQVPLSMSFPRQEYCSGQPFPSPGDFPNLGTEPVSSTLQVDSLLLSHQGSTKYVFKILIYILIIILEIYIYICEICNHIHKYMYTKVSGRKKQSIKIICQNVRIVGKCSFYLII